MPEIKIDPIQIAPPVIPDADITGGVIESITEIVSEDNLSNAGERAKANASATLTAVEKAADSAIEVINQVEKGDTAKDVASKAADNGNIDVSTTGSTADMTQAAENTASAGMNVKTNGGDEKKYQLGFSLSGYKSIIQKDNSPQNSMNGIASSMQNTDIAWLVSLYNLYENDGAGFSQCKPCTDNNGKQDGVGMTVGAFSITQKDNFKDLAKYMRDYLMPEEYCVLVEQGYGSNQDVQGKNGLSLYGLIKNLCDDKNKGTENYIKFVKAQTKFFAERWWLAAIWGIYKSGVKTKLGMGAIGATIGHTGGFPKQMQTGGLVAGKLYSWCTDVDEIAKLEPSVAGPDKEKDWIIAYFSKIKSSIKTRWPGIACEAEDFKDQANINLDVTEFKTRKHKTLKYGEWVPRSCGT